MMLTRCPACGTAFRVSALQLKAKQGKVRCGHCRRVFNALTTLVDGPPFPTPPTPPAAEAQAELLPAASVQFPPAEAPDAGPPEAAYLPASPEPDAPYQFELPPEPLLHEKAVAKSRTWLWVVGTLLAMTLLLLQAVLKFRTELSVLLPEARPALLASCALLGCDLSLPRKPDLLGIEASDLHPDPGGHLVLAATLKNRAPFVQAYPALELTLTDTGDQPLIRKVIPPKDYLPKDTEVAMGFAANSELALNLSIQSDVGGAAGYRIYLFYP